VGGATNSFGFRFACDKRREAHHSSGWPGIRHIGRQTYDKPDSGKDKIETSSLLRRADLVLEMVKSDNAAGALAEAHLLVTDAKRMVRRLSSRSKAKIVDAAVEVVTLLEERREPSLSGSKTAREVSIFIKRLRN
jgi:hypothetical protein